MIASVLMPSRGRVELAKASIASLGEGDFEVWVAVDKDDPQLEEYEKLDTGNVHVLICHRYGYEQLHRYYNAMSRRSLGDWLVLWNDDATMQTKDWLERLKGYDHTLPIVLDLWYMEGNLFPALSRKFYEIIGHYSLSAHSDSWPENVAVNAGVQITVPNFFIEHLGERLVDPTHRRVWEVIAKTKEEFYSPESIALRNGETQKIMKYMEEYRAKGNN